jgi:L-arabinonolactonase
MAIHASSQLNVITSLDGVPSVGRATLAVDARCELGEGPLWSVNDQAIYWIDCINRTISRYFPGTGKTDRFEVSGLPSCYAFRSSGGLLFAFRNRLAFVDLDAGTEQAIPSPGLDFAIERFNDGKCDSRGRFFVGTMDKERKSPRGGLYRLDADLCVTKVADGVTLSNGLAWSLDDRTMYQCESRPGIVYGYDYDAASGNLSDRRVVIDTTPTHFHPDGCARDVEGCLWIALPGSGKIARFSPEGRLIATLEVPTPRVTSVAFGGQDLDTLYITSMRYNVPESILKENPAAGGIFAAVPGVKGMPEPLFAG